MLIALIIFMFTYLLISLRRWRLLNFERPATALFGAMLMLVFSVITPQQALSAVELNIVFLLLGMMVIVASIEKSGFFSWASAKIVRKSKTGTQFLMFLMVTSAGLSALFLNDAVVLFYTPIIIKSCKTMKLDPVPFLVAEIMAANIGSVATEIGNPQNAYIAIHSNITFVQWLIVMVPIAIISLIFAMFIIYILSKDKISKKIDVSVSETPNIENPGFMYFSLIVLIGTFSAFFIFRDISTIALIGGVTILFFSPFFKGINSKIILKNVDWTILLFFIGLFIVLKGVEVSGISSSIMQDLASININMSQLSSLVIISTILSNLVSNVPAVMLLSQFIPVSSSHMWLALAMSSTLSGNMTIVGAAANVIVLELAANMGVEISWKQFLKIGIPVTLITLFLGTLILLLI